MVGPRPERADVPQHPDRAPLGRVAPRRVQEGHQGRQYQAGQAGSDVADDHWRLPVQLPGAQRYPGLRGDHHPQQPARIQRDPGQEARPGHRPLPVLVRLEPGFVPDLPRAGLPAHERLGLTAIGVAHLRGQLTHPPPPRELNQSEHHDRDHRRPRHQRHPRGDQVRHVDRVGWSPCPPDAQPRFPHRASRC